MECDVDDISDSLIDCEADGMSDDLIDGKVDGMELVGSLDCVGDTEKLYNELSIVGSSVILLKFKIGLDDICKLVGTGVFCKIVGNIVIENSVGLIVGNIVLLEVKVGADVLKLVGKVDRVGYREELK